MGWKGKKIVVIGLARQGTSLTRYFVGQGANVVVSDLRSQEALANELDSIGGEAVTVHHGAHPLSLLDSADLLCLSGGVSPDIPIASEGRRRGIPISNDSQIFLDQCSARTIGITGSAGKTTTVSLVGHLARTSQNEEVHRVWVGGNMGRPLLDDLAEIAKEDIVVIELSSFQLELMSASTDAAVILNLTPNHLDRHRTMEAYIGAKKNILIHQNADGIAILNHDDMEVWSLRDEVRGKLWSFGLRDLKDGNGVFVDKDNFMLRRGEAVETLANIRSLRIRGRHNVLNAAAGLAAAAAVEMNLEDLDGRLESFEGVEHRLEIVREMDGVRWVNDSIATSPERAIAAMDAFDNPILLLAGGRDKLLPWGRFAEVVSHKVKRLILFGESGSLIETSVRKQLDDKQLPTIVRYEKLSDAIQDASRIAEPGDVVLLAPGGTSFDEFHDFAERGNYFRDQVKAF